MPQTAYEYSTYVFLSKYFEYLLFLYFQCSLTHWISLTIFGHPNPWTNDKSIRTRTLLTSYSVAVTHPRAERAHLRLIVPKMIMRETPQTPSLAYKQDINIKPSYCDCYTSPFQVSFVTKMNSMSELSLRAWRNLIFHNAQQLQDLRVTKLPPIFLKRCCYLSYISLGLIV